MSSACIHNSTTMHVDTEEKKLLNKSIFFLKGIVQTKMEILSSFTHPQVVPNLYEFLCSAKYKGRCVEESSFFRISSFVVQQNKDIHTGLDLLEGE